MHHHIWIYTAYHFLVANNLWRALVTWTIGAVMARLIGIPKAWRKHLKNQEVIADRLDTSTPGGLGDLQKDLGNHIADDLGQEIEQHA